MNIHPRSFKPSHALFALTVVLALGGCDPEAVAPDEPGEALAAADPDPDQIAQAEPGEEAPQWGNECGEDFINAAERLCIDENIRQPKPYRWASLDCREDRARLCSMDDLHWLYRNSNLDSNYNPKQGNKVRWIGNYVGDDMALCGNRSITGNNDPDQDDFDGECWASEKHAYWCCRDEKSKKGGGDDDGGWDDDDGGWDDGNHDGGWDDGDHDGGWDGK